MSDFNLAIPVILHFEGGWVNNPVDPGGETNFGISMLMIQHEWISAKDLGLPNLDPGCMKLLTVDTAKMLYRKYFWDKFGYSNIINQTAATKVFDCSVNCGPTRGCMIAQKAANRLGHNIKVDGSLGPASFAAINACNPSEFLHAMAGEMQLYYEFIVAKNPKLKVFLSNWTRRAAWAG